MQQINLYQPEFRPRRVPVSAAQILAAVVAASVLLLSVAGYQAWRLGAASDQVAAAEARRDAMLAQVEELKRKYPPARRSRLLEAELERLRGEVEARRRVAGILETGTFGNTTGFSAHLESLARQHVSGMWLTRFRISNGGGALDIGGSARRPELVPRYLRRLSGQPEFAGIEFANLELVRPEDDAGRVDFRMMTAEYVR